MAKPSPLFGLMSFCDCSGVCVSGDFETIGYVQFHVVCELEKKKHTQQNSKVMTVSLEWGGTIFHYSIHLKVGLP